MSDLKDFAMMVLVPLAMLYLVARPPKVKGKKLLSGVLEGLCYLCLVGVAIWAGYFTIAGVILGVGIGMKLAERSPTI